MKAVIRPKMRMTLVITRDEGFTDGQHSLIGHICGVLDVEFGKKCVDRSLDVGDWPETGIRTRGEFIPLRVDVQDLLRGLNRNPGPRGRYRLDDVDRVTFEFLEDGEGGKIKMSLWPKIINEGEGPILTSTFSAVQAQIEVAGIGDKRCG
jgi:hypothetical protein